ncbi:MAG: membrane protein insertion efficiency factor YidD [Phycisphaerales bacterium]|nr:membrane protein insertion efficiency factor YidD [Phycisphaerales bacterium]
MDSKNKQPKCNRHGFANAILIGCVRIYQAIGSPFLGGHCRFHPTCSHYAVEAFELHGPLKGSWLTMRRLLRCHPFARAGFDPVPSADTTGDEA